MKAVVVQSPRRATIESFQTPAAARGQVVIAMEGCGICGSDLAVWEGRPWFDYPQPAGAPGHEGWGVVEAVGDGVDQSLLGQRVAAISYRAHADRDLADAHAVVALPAPLDGRAFPGEAIGCAVNVFERSDISAASTVAVVGVGFLGALLIQLIANAGARVIALSRRPFALEVAQSMGAEATVRLSPGPDPVSRVREWAGEAMCDRVIEATGSQSPLDLAGELTGTRGRLIIAGYHQDGLRTVNMQQWNWKGIDVINAHERDRSIYVSGMAEAVRAFVDGRLDPSPLLTHSFPLDRIDQAFQMAEERPDGFLKAVVRV